jgi:tRNA (guanine10-N2)-methyltransferase
LLQGYCIGQLNEKSTYYDPSFVKQRPYVWHNFRQYGLPLPEYIRMDINLDKAWGTRANGFFDSIITDPPYGLRASIAKEKEKEKGLV